MPGTVKQSAGKKRRVVRRKASKKASKKVMRKVNKKTSKKQMRKVNKKTAKKPAAGKKRKPSAYNMHIKAEMKKGKSMKEAAASWRAKK